MTFLEKAMEMDRSLSMEEIIDDYCPSSFGFPDEKYASECRYECASCWNREIPDVSDIEDSVTPEKIEELKKEPVNLSRDEITELHEIVDKAMSDTPHILDSGNRREFASGAVRDMHAGKGDMASIPWEAILRLSVHYENGATKYERWNFRKGIPVSSFIDSACRHLAKYQCGCDDEDHLAAAAFNVLGAMLMENTKPEMQDLPLREGRNTFDYFKKDL